MYQPATYNYLPQERVIYGQPVAQAVAGEMDRLGAEGALIICSRSVAAGRAVRAVKEALGRRIAGVFDGCTQHTPRTCVIEAAKAARAADADLIVTIGGGSAIDAAKTLLLCLAADIADEGELGEYRLQFDAEGKRLVPDVPPMKVRQIIVPTTLSGAEFSDLAGVTDPDRGIKDAYTAREMAARSVILDPEATLDTPDWLWLSTAIRSVDHAVETLCSTAPQPLADAGASQALWMLSAALPATKREPENLSARLSCQLAVWLATMGLGRVPYGASHGIGHQLGAVAGVPHGHCSCVLLPSVLRYNAEVNAERQTMVAAAMGGPDRPAADVVEALVRDLDQPTRLRDVGAKRDQFDAIAGSSLDNLFVRSNPRPITDARQIVEILEAAW
jgi:alcohol dehydrogenase class IV